MARKWFGLRKTAEEPAELIVELMKLGEFPNGKHPGRRRNVILSTEDELGDTLGAINYFIDRNKLDRKRIERRAMSKYKKFSGWWGIPKPFKILMKKTPKNKKK